MTDTAIALTGRTLGSLLYHPPLSQHNVALLEALAKSDWAADWPVSISESTVGLIRQGLDSTWRQQLAMAYQQLFIGPDALPAPPWGSVYLDRESVLFGESTLALRQWLHQQGIAALSPPTEPEDHIGLLLMLAAWLAENNTEALAVLLEQHLLPWAGRYLTLLEAGAGHPFYQGVAQLAQATLADWRQRCRAEPCSSRLYC